MLLTLLLDPHWGSLDRALPQLFLFGVLLPLVLGLVLRAMGKSEDRPEGAESRGWSTRRAVTVTLSAALLILLVGYCR